MLYVNAVSNHRPGELLDNKFKSKSEKKSSEHGRSKIFSNKK